MRQCCLIEEMIAVLGDDLARILFTSISVVRESPESTITIFPSFLPCECKYKIHLRVKSAAGLRCECPPRKAIRIRAVLIVHHRSLAVADH